GRQHLHQFAVLARGLAARDRNEPLPIDRAVRGRPVAGERAREVVHRYTRAKKSRSTRLPISGGSKATAPLPTIVQMTKADVLRFLDGGDFDALVGAVETAEVDFKRSPYRLNEASEAFELAKDVTALANTETGGILVVGFQTDRRRSPDWTRWRRSIRSRDR